MRLGRLDASKEPGKNADGVLARLLELKCADHRERCGDCDSRSQIDQPPVPAWHPGGVDHPLGDLELVGAEHLAVGHRQPGDDGDRGDEIGDGRDGKGI